LKENLLWVRNFDTVDDLRRALLEFREAHNATWLIERNGFKPPDAAFNRGSRRIGSSKVSQQPRAVHWLAARCGRSPGSNVQDRDGAEPLLRQAHRLFPFIEKIIGDRAIRARRWPRPLPVQDHGKWKSCAAVITSLCRAAEAVDRARTLDWISRKRRLVRDSERHGRIAAAFVRMAMIRIMLRRLDATPST
jgi:hypothetical protein